MLMAESPALVHRKGRAGAGWAGSQRPHEDHLTSRESPTVRDPRECDTSSRAYSDGALIFAHAACASLAVCDCQLSSCVVGFSAAFDDIRQHSMMIMKMEMVVVVAVVLHFLVVLPACVAFNATLGWQTISSKFSRWSVVWCW